MRNKKRNHKLKQLKALIELSIDIVEELPLEVDTEEYLKIINTDLYVLSNSINEIIKIVSEENEK